MRIEFEFSVGEEWMFAELADLLVKQQCLRQEARDHAGKVRVEDAWLTKSLENALTGAGIRYMCDVQAMSDERLTRIHGIKAVGLAEIRKWQPQDRYQRVGEMPHRHWKRFPR